MSGGLSSMTHEVERRGDALVVTPHGRIGEMEAHPFERELLALIEQGSVKLVLDLSDVSFVTSTALGAFMVAHKRVKAKQGYVRIVRPQPLVRQILEITKLVKLFGIYRSVDAAIAGR
jgi:anti-anti-sigma factor